MLLAGPNGVGKSALVGRWLAQLDRRLFCPLLLTHASLSGCGLLSALASKLGQRATFRREANLALIEAALAQLGKVVPLIVLDEAQSFGYGSLEEVRLLLGRTWPTRRPLAWCSSATNTCWAPCACVNTARSSRASPATGA